MATTTTELGLLAAARTLSVDFALAAVELRSDDGRRWRVEMVPACPGRFRLFDVGDAGLLCEHDAIDGDYWCVGDVLDYLRAVGARRPIGGAR